LKNGGEVRRCHSILVRLGREDGEEIKDIEKQLFVEWGKFPNQLLVGRDSLCVIKSIRISRRSIFLNLPLVCA
jgi:hypothetical protein